MSADFAGIFLIHILMKLIFFGMDLIFNKRLYFDHDW